MTLYSKVLAGYWNTFNNMQRWSRFFRRWGADDKWPIAFASKDTELYAERSQRFLEQVHVVLIGDPKKTYIRRPCPASGRTDNARVSYFSLLLLRLPKVGTGLQETRTNTFYIYCMSIAQDTCNQWRIFFQWNCSNLFQPVPACSSLFQVFVMSYGNLSSVELSSWKTIDEYDTLMGLQPSKRL